MALCANNQALHDVTIDLRRSGLVVEQDVRAPMDEDYRFILSQGAKSPDGSEDPTVAFACKHSSVISLTLTVTHEDESASESKTYMTSCPFGEGNHPSTLLLGQAHLKKGMSRVEIVNNESLGLPAPGRAKVLLVGNGVPR